MHMKLYRTYRLPYLIFLSLFRVLIRAEKIPFIAKLSAGVTCILYFVPLKKVPSHVAPKKKKNNNNNKNGQLVRNKKKIVRNKKKKKKPIKQNP